MNGVSVIAHIFVLALKLLLYLILVSAFPVASSPLFQVHCIYCTDCPSGFSGDRWVYNSLLVAPVV